MLETFQVSMLIRILSAVYGPDDACALVESMTDDPWWIDRFRTVLRAITEIADGDLSNPDIIRLFVEAYVVKKPDLLN